MTTQTSTKIWRSGPEGNVLVATFAGLPYGTEPQVSIPNLGHATRTGLQKSGSAEGERVVAVDYTLL